METTLLTSSDIKRALTRISHEILEKNKGTEKLALVGIRTRGVFLAKRIQEFIKNIENVTLPLGVLDITLYRDDLGSGKQNAVVKNTDLPFAVDGQRVVLVDDVLFTGRTIRAAIDALIDYGRPDCVQLAVLIDRGHREFPIRPDFVGKNLPTEKNNRVQLRLKEEDGSDEVLLMEESD